MRDAFRGARDTALFEFARGLKAEGAARGTVLSRLLLANLAHCRPPLLDDEVRRIVREIYR